MDKYDTELLGEAAGTMGCGCLIAALNVLSYVIVVGLCALVVKWIMGW